MQKGVFIIISLICAGSLFAQKELLQSGPMNGYSEMREAAIWVQTKSHARVYIRYHDANNAGKKFHSNTVETMKCEAFTALLIADSVEPGRKYHYDLYINDVKVEIDYPLFFQTQKLWQYRNDPPEFSFVTGSGAYINEEAYDRPGKPYGGDYHIFESIAKSEPDFMLWLGDNVYLREPDWNSMTGIVNRYTHDRAIPEMQPMLGSMHHYAIWDDHDFGPNNSDRSFWNKENTLKAFELFWANPSYGVGDIKGAITAFQWADVDFFLLDNRYYRAPNYLEAGDKTMLGKEQLNWLKDALVSSHATYKLIVMGGQFLNTCEEYETYTNYGFKGERDHLINYIDEQNINGVVFITGDRHHSEISKLTTEKNKLEIYDITSSPFTSGAHKMASKENNQLRIQGSLITRRNYALISFKGPRNDRKLVLDYYDSDGKHLYNFEISR